MTLTLQRVCPSIGETGQLPIKGGAMTQARGIEQVRQTQFFDHVDSVQAHKA